MRPLALALVGLALLAGCSSTPSVPAAEAPPVSGISAAGTTASTVADPVRVAIPKLHVSDEIVPVGLQSDGQLAIPKVTEVGWYTGLPRPGDVGASLLAGHVNYDGTQGSFARIGELTVGDTITVTDTASVVRTFAVDSVVEFPKTQYKARAPALFTATGAELRIVTCSGRVVDHEYLDNTVVNAHLVTT